MSDLPNSADSDAWRRPPAFPPDWAEAWGDDPYGLWAEFSVGEAVQRLRWIEPGEFWMGSPEDERAYADVAVAGRLARAESPRHRVRLTRGFWLADTTCTQAMWLAVMKGNPSQSPEDLRRPVDHVNWDDAQDFVQRLHVTLPEIVGAMLPSEAQWEYACRAGTHTAFSFGDRLKHGQVNCRGTWPPSGNTGDGQSTGILPARALAPNPWGLYQMHGNVWEWCADDWRTYPLDAAADVPIDDPVGPVPAAHGANRATRGGSRYYVASDARSAFRHRDARSMRSHDLGFRILIAQ